MIVVTAPLRSTRTLIAAPAPSASGHDPLCRRLISRMYGKVSDIRDHALVDGPSTCKMQHRAHVDHVRSVDLPRVAAGKQRRKVARALTCLGSFDLLSHQPVIAWALHLPEDADWRMREVLGVEPGQRECVRRIVPLTVMDDKPVGSFRVRGLRTGRCPRARGLRTVHWPRAPGLHARGGHFADLQRAMPAEP